ncbi:MAG: hypothetical protein D6756_04285, partial [Cyanobacteria bacterium J083]
MKFKPAYRNSYNLALPLIASASITCPLAANEVNLADKINLISQANINPSGISVSEQETNFSIPSWAKDPLPSPYPIPAEWIFGTQARSSQTKQSSTNYYRTSQIISPDGKFAAYSRLELQAEPELPQSQVNSVLFIENLQTGELEEINTQMYFIQLPEAASSILPGVMKILIPASWSKNGKYLLVRQLEGIFSSSDVSDVALVWDSNTSQIKPLLPLGVEYTTAVLLGWSSAESERILFRASILGEEPHTWAVYLNGQTVLAEDDQPLSITYGSIHKTNWI